MLEAASQTQCDGHLTSSETNLTTGSLKRVAAAVQEGADCRLETLEGIRAVKREMVREGANFCAWATKVRDGGYGSWSK